MNQSNTFKKFKDKVGSLDISKDKVKATFLSLYKDLSKETRMFFDLIRKNKGRILSLDIGKRTLKIALLSLTKEAVYLLKYDIKEIRIKEPQDEERFLKEFISNFIVANSITETDIIISLLDLDSLVLRMIELPNVPEKEIREALKWELKDKIPFELDRAQFDWQLVNEYTDKEGAKKKDIMIACARKDLIERYVRIIKDTGLNIIDIKTPSFNYSYLLEKLEVSKKGLVAVLDIGGIDSTFSIYKDSKLMFLRSLPFSSEQVTTSISEILSPDETDLELKREKAEEIKKEFGIPQDFDQVLKDDIKGGQVIASMRPSLERLVSETNRSINYYATKFESEAPKFLFITGGGSNLKGLDAYLKNEFKFEVDRFPLWGVIKIGKGINKDKFDKDMERLMSPMGAAIGMNKKPNLLPQEYRTEKVETLEKMSLRLIGITLGLIFLFSLLIVRSQVNDYKSRLKHARVHLQTISKISDMDRWITQRLSVVRKIQSDRIPADWVLKELSNLMPSSCVLERVELDNEKRVLILNGYIISLSRKVKTEDELTAFMEKLEASPFFDEAMLRFLEKAKYKEKDASKFEIQCDLKK